MFPDKLRLCLSCMDLTTVNTTDTAGKIIAFTEKVNRFGEHFPNYANIYGSIYAVALSMLWLYCCISIVFYGGVLNHYLATWQKA